MFNIEIYKDDKLVKVYTTNTDIKSLADDILEYELIDDEYTAKTVFGPQEYDPEIVVPVRFQVWLLGHDATYRFATDFGNYKFESASYAEAKEFFENFVYDQNTKLPRDVHTVTLELEAVVDNSEGYEININTLDSKLMM